MIFIKIYIYIVKKKKSRNVQFQRAPKPIHQHQEEHGNATPVADSSKLNGLQEEIQELYESLRYLKFKINQTHRTLKFLAT